MIAFFFDPESIRDRLVLTVLTEGMFPRCGFFQSCAEINTKNFVGQ